MRSLRQFLIVILIGVFTLSFTSNVYAEKKLKKRIAVFDFDDKSGHRLRWYRSDQPVGHGMADMLVTALVKSGEFIVIERQAIQKIMQEQKLGMSGMVTPQSAAQVGKLLGVELAVMGSVTEFGYSKSEKKGGFRGIGGGLSTSKSTVGIDVRLINTTTGEIIAAESVRKEEKSRGVSFRKGMTNFENKKKFDDSIVGKATRKAINRLVELITKQMASIPWSGKVIMEKGGVIYVNAGSTGGVSIGDKFEVFRAGEELIDPDTGLNLGTTESKIGIIEITEDIANGKASKAKSIKGQSFRKGDIVKEM
ncbi:MAG: hypothetical protein KAR38_09950 [Calditrichia bacterium]|nr:hypothetical protein [Calditrichia bacterium]